MTIRFIQSLASNNKTITILLFFYLFLYEHIYLYRIRLGRYIRPQVNNLINSPEGNGKRYSPTPPKFKYRVPSHLNIHETIGINKRRMST
jgi:hypothetical protein